MTSSTPEAILKKVFGYSQFKPHQREIIDNILKKRDSLAILPTGGGKSLCYQIPALVFPGLTVVVSPLIALMKDQVEQLQAWGVPALFLNSTLSSEEYQSNMTEVRAGRVKLLYVAPETLLTPRLFSLLESVPVDCLTIDEAHCISEWGHDFRPEYRQLVEVRRRFPKAVCLALTATATGRVRQDIMNTLGLKAANEFVASFNRDNLLIEVAPKTDPLAQTLHFLQRFKDQSGIIYCFSRKQVDTLAATLGRRGYSVRSYHAGLDDSERRRSQELFIRDDVQIIVATIAFGMGINKPNVRFVIHYDLPKSIESYYQEIGRAGRDGLPAHCLLLYSYGDVQKLKYFIEQKEGTERQVAYDHLNALTRYAETDFCRRIPLLSYFGEQYTSENCGMCDNCLAGESRLTDITLPVQKFLSCVIRTGEIFGAVHVIDVLLASENQKILKFNHHELSTYGIGKELTRKQWLHISRQLIQKGLLLQDDRFGGLKLTPRAYEVLKNKETFLGVLQEEEQALAPTKKPGELDYDRELFEILRRERKDQADAAGVPPYVIFSDRTLVEMAAYYPMSPASLLKINGVGQVKLRRYGAAFIELIQDYCTRHNLKEKFIPGSGKTERSDPKETRTARFIEVGEAYNAGQSVQELADLYRVQKTTILDHLAQYALAGRSLRSGLDLQGLSTLSAEMQSAVMTAFEELGAETLKPAYDRLSGAVPFDELKLMRLVFLSQKMQDRKVTPNAGL